MELSRFENDPPQALLGGRCVVRWFYRLRNTDAVALILCTLPEHLEAIRADFLRAQRATSSEQSDIVERFKHVTRYEGPILPEIELKVRQSENTSSGPAIEQLGLF